MRVRLSKSLLSFLLVSGFYFSPVLGGDFVDSCHSLIENFLTENISSFPKVSPEDILKRKADLDKAELDYFDVIPWRKNSRLAIRIRRFFIDKLKVGFLKRQQLPQVDESWPLGPVRVNINDIRFLQFSARNTSSDGQYNVIDNAKSLRKGTLRAEEFFRIRVFRDIQGRFWTLDHRRLAAMKLSGAFSVINVEVVGEEVAAKSLFKFSSRNEGQSLLVILGDGSSLVLANESLLKEID